MIPMLYVVTPLVGLSFPLLTPLIMATAGAMGYKVMVDMKEGGHLNEALMQRLHETTTLAVKVDDLVLDSMNEEVKRAESLYFERDGIQLTVRKDERGKLRIEASARKGVDEKLLKEAGREFAEHLAQLFSYNRAAKEVEALNAEIIEEQVGEQGEIVLKVRRWT